MSNPTLFDPNKLLFIRRRLDEADVEHLVHFSCLPGFIPLRLTNISVVLLLLHAARERDQRRFLVELFLPWVGIQRRLAISRDRLADDFVRIGDFAEGSREELVHLVQIYRFIVAELWDPYMSLPYGCYQFLDDSFTDMLTANLGQGERSKSEYVESRLKALDPELRLLSGYNHIARNAITHKGSHGVTYSQGGVVFRDIKRGQPPKVEMLEWSRESLFENVALLYEFVLAVDAAVTVFGLDCRDAIEDKEIEPAFILHVLNNEERRGIRATQEARLAAVRNSEDMSENEKIEALSRILFLACGERGLPISAVRIASEADVLCVVLPKITEQPLSDTALRKCILGFVRYAVLAETVFGSMFSKYATLAATESGYLSVVLGSQLLHEYGEEEAGLVDLLHEAVVTLGDTTVTIDVDFDAVREAETQHLGLHFPRKRRPS